MIENFMGIMVFLTGLCLGSFLNVCIYRIPNGKSIVFPPSACPACGKRLGFVELIPVLSFLGLRAHCLGCGGKISWRYPLVELLTGSLLLAVYAKFGLALETVTYSILILTLIIISFIDIDLQIIPNSIVIPGAVIGLAFGYSHIEQSVLGLLTGFGVIALVIVLSGGKMGWGDAKLLGMIGAFLGWQAPLYSLFIGSLLGAIFGVTMILFKKLERKTPIPFGPFLSLGALMWIFFPWWFR